MFEPYHTIRYPALAVIDPSIHTSVPLTVAVLDTPSTVRAPDELVMLPALQNDVAVSAAVIAAVALTPRTVRAPAVAVIEPPAHTDAVVSAAVMVALL